MAGEVQRGGKAWYDASRADFVAQAAEAVAGRLALAGGRDGWVIEDEQIEQWQISVEQLQRRLQARAGGPVAALRVALDRSDTHEVQDVILEYDLRRRGLRVDCVLLAPGAILVIEFKSRDTGATARDQVMGYGVSLLEFHAETRRAVDAGAIVVPIVALTGGRNAYTAPVERWLRRPYQGMLACPITCGADHLGNAIRDALGLRREPCEVARSSWLASDFSPSSNILDAAISLYGSHEVSAVAAHAASVQDMAACGNAIRGQIDAVRDAGGRRVVFLSGAPGAGKTLVGLDLAFDIRYRQDAVFVTGNAPLVEVLDAALRASYRRGRQTGALVAASGYAREHVREVVERSTFKLVKAHAFLGERGQRTGSRDGAILVFDEAQRTYERGRRVAGHALADHEAVLILQALEESCPRGAVVVALLGQNQAINRGERGAGAWFEAAIQRGWTFAVADETLDLLDPAEVEAWRVHPLRVPLAHGHLRHSMRFYRNAGLERWAHHVLGNQDEQARHVAEQLDATGDTVWLTRDLEAARAWARRMRVGEERAGIIASSQARRLAAYGLHVDLKPDIATWMLAPSADFRSSNMLETAQNQYQIQGLEIDWSIVCWGADLRRQGGRWSAYKLSGGVWQRDRAEIVAKNGYRVLLTRARKGMVIFVPTGDITREDPTREPAFYEGTADHLLSCGARPMPEE